MKHKVVLGLSVLALLTASPVFAQSTMIKEGNYTLNKTSVVVNGKTAYTSYVFAAKDPNSGVMTTFIPIWYIMQVMKHAGVGNHWNGNTHALTLTGKSASLTIHGAHGNASIMLNGKTVESGVPSFAVKDPNSGVKTTFFGLYYAEKMLDALGFNNTWNGGAHTWTIKTTGTGGKTSTTIQPVGTQAGGGALTMTYHSGGTGSDKGAGITYGAGTIG